MDDQTTQKDPARKAAEPAIKAAAAEKDLSSEIAQAVDREPSDHVRCVRVFGNYYRCNWWSRQGGAGATLDYDWNGLFTDFVRKSRFLDVTIQTGELVIKEVSSVGARRDGKTPLVK